MKNVLILEDDETSQKIIGSVFSKKVNLFQAYTLEQAEKIFDENKSRLDIVILDGLVPTEKSRFKDTIELAGYIRTNFDGIMFSISQSDSYKRRFKGLGMEILEYKFDVLDRLNGLITE